MDVFEQITMVFVVFAVLGSLLWVLRKKGVASFRFGRKSSGNGKQLEVIERLPLTASHSVHLIRVGNRTLLVGVAPGGCTLLERSESVDPAFFQKPSA